MRYLPFRLGLGTAVAWAAVVVAAGQTPPAPQAPSVLAGAYTKEQAARGEKLYTDKCMNCHGETLAGVEQALPLAGPEFTGPWNNEPLSALLSKIRQMPPDRPSDLTRVQMVEVLAYILSYNGLPAGKTLLSDEQSVLTKIMFQTPLQAY